MALPNIAKRQAFVQHYVAFGNATRAAIAAGCHGGSASVTAHRWLRNPTVLALLRDEINRYLRDLAPGALNALRHLVEMASHRRTAHPIFWAPFVVVGEGGVARP